MAKDKDSIDDKPWYVKEREMRSLGEQYGVDYEDYQRDGRGGSGRDDYERFEKDVIAAGSNDYDTRRSIEAAKLAGYEGAADLDNGLNTLQSLQDATDFMRGVHEDELGHTGKFSSINDYANVTNFFVNNDRDMFKQEMEKSFGDYIEENQPETADPLNQQATDIEFSPELQAAQARVSEYEKGLGQKNSVYDKSLDGADDAKMQGEGHDQRNNAAQNFADAYKLELSTDIKRGMA